MLAKGSMETKLQNANIVLRIIDDDATLRTSLTEYGFDQVRLDEGRTLFREARERLSGFQQQRGRNLEAGEQLRETRKSIRQGYIDTLILARRALVGEAEMRLALDLDGPRSRREAGWIAQAWIFYKNINEPIQRKLDRFGLTATRLATGVARLKELTSQHARRKEHHADYLNARIGRQSAFTALTEWLRDLLTVLRIIARGNEPLNVKLGLVPSRKRPPKAQETQDLTPPPEAVTAEPEKHTTADPDRQSEINRQGPSPERHQEIRDRTRKPPAAEQRLAQKAVHPRSHPTSHSVNPQAQPP